MPFSRENWRFTVLVIGFVLLCMTTVTGVVAIAYSPNITSTPLITAVISYVSIQASNVLVMIRVEQSNKEIAKTRHDIREELTPIKLEVEDVQRKIANGHDEKQEQCPRCKAMNSVTANFCCQCGEKLDPMSAGVT